MRKEHEEAHSSIWLTEAGWKAQKLIATELRRRREAAGLTREQLAEKMGEPYTADIISQYEDGSEVPMETWPVLDMIETLNMDMNEITPQSLLAKQCTESGYADLNEESRHIVDGVIQAVLKGQSPNL